MTKRRYQTEFPDFGTFDLPLPDGFADTSWHNDVCPSFERDLGDDTYLRIFVDYANPADRENPGAKRFTCQRVMPDGDTVRGLHSDAWQAVLTWAKGFA